MNEELQKQGLVAHLLREHPWLKDYGLNSNKDAVNPAWSQRANEREKELRAEIGRLNDIIRRRDEQGTGTASDGQGHFVREAPVPRRW